MKMTFCDVPNYCREVKRSINTAQKWNLLGYLLQNYFLIFKPSPPNRSGTDLWQIYFSSYKCTLYICKVVHNYV